MFYCSLFSNFSSLLLYTIINIIDYYHALTMKFFPLEFHTLIYTDKNRKDQSELLLCATAVSLTAEQLPSWAMLAVW
jgi:hypothetical protein